MSELPTPPRAEETPPLDVLRVWIVDQELHCSLQADAFPDPATWGVVLADVVRHIARAFLEQEGKDTRETTRRVLTEMHTELGTPETPAANEPKE